jgi:ornithine cyclodeaminase
MAFRAVSAALIAAASEDSAVSFPPVLGHGSDIVNRFSIKAASTPTLAGVKIGSYWSHNLARGDPAHNSSIVFFDQSCGRVCTFIEASIVNGYRTAAANALAVQNLTRPDASRLAIFGAGHQALYECAAVREVRPIREVLVVNRDPAKAQSFVDFLRRDGLEAAQVSAEEACRSADIIVTVTASRTPLFEPDWVRPGTHVSCMGADAVGKQELPPALLSRARLFCDQITQSLVIGELQHVASEVYEGRLTVTNLGDVLAGRCPAGVDPEAVTVFDSSGLALQDLFIGVDLLAEAEKRGMVLELQPAGAPGAFGSRPED